MEKKELDWAHLGFEYIKTDYRFSAKHINGKWEDGSLVESEIISVHEGAPALHYAQQCFEGMKAQTGQDDNVLLFRPDLNSTRINEAASRILVPEVPREMFFSAIEEVVRANQAWIPPYGSGASLYIRPILIGVGKNLGVRPAEAYEFRVFVSPVGPYFKSSGLAVISLAVSDTDRASPHGTGSYKIGANYAGGLLASREAKALGADEALYLDAAEQRYIDEAGSANIVVSMTGNRFVTPSSNAILPSITRRSLTTLAKDCLKMNVENRPIDLRGELDEFEEVAACGTAAVLSPVGKIFFDDQWHSFYGDGKAVGPVMQELYDLLVGIQKGDKEDPYGWIHQVQV